MPTTFHATNFKNLTISSLLGKASNTAPIRYINFFNGVQPADPSVTPAGSSVFAITGGGINTSTFMSAPAVGVSVLAAPRSLNATTSVSAITFARVEDSNGAAIMDTSATLVGGGGGAIVPSLASTSGVAYQIDGFSIKMPQVLGAVMLNIDLVNALASMWGVVVANIGLGASASIKVFSGAAPASADAPATGTLLVTFTTAASGASWGTVSAGAASLASNLTAVAAATGTAGYVRIEKGAFVLQGSVGTSGTDFILDTVSIVSAATITLTEATISI